ncbi:MAG: hypothetical protein AAF215_32450 [Cyanobacteria bacterium P01_A01_bin.123]
MAQLALALKDVDPVQPALPPVLARHLRDPPTGFALEQRYAAQPAV